MRLPSILLAVSALTVLASDSALAAVAGASEDAKVSTMASTMASPDLDVLAVSHSATRFLRGLESVGEVDEDRVAGAKLFDAAKLKRAMDDSKYAETLMKRWKRHGFDIEDAKIRLNASRYAKDEKLNAIYLKYAAWLDTHFSRLPGVKPSGGDDLFNKAKLEVAIKDGNYKRTLFKEWKTHNYESEAVFKQLNALGRKDFDNTLDRLYVDYVIWLNVHFPHPDTLKLAKEPLLFKESMLLKARTDVDYAQSLFLAWKMNFSLEKVTENLKITFANADNMILRGYTNWLINNFR
uniref:RxLR effector protein n=1 Tax=Phytophthora sojae TaxID=67593 RepID=G1FQX8_PHYSO|nr:Avh29 [Phytophthora sojae]